MQFLHNIFRPLKFFFYFTCNRIIRQTVHTSHAFVHQAVKLAAALLRVARVTAGLAEVVAAYRRVYDSRHLQADCQEPGSAPEPYARQSSTGYLYHFKIINALLTT